MKVLTIFAASVFAASLAVTGAMAGDAYQERSGAASGSGQGISGEQSSSGLSQSGAEQLDPSQLRQIQQQLTTLGYAPGNVEGELDSQTMEAIRNFQQAQGIQPTGQLNMQTLQALGVSPQEGEVQQYHGISPEFDQSQQPVQQIPEGTEQPGRQMEQQPLNQGEPDPYAPQQTQPQGTMGR